MACGAVPRNRLCPARLRLDCGNRALKTPSEGRPAAESHCRVAAWNSDGTAKFRLVIGLCQISWLPLPGRMKLHPAARKRSRRGRSNCGAIQATAGSASRSAVICR